jgi:hypothetical protein
MNIQNPVERRPKGHSKSNKRMKNTLESSSTKTQYICKLCKQKGHNSKTCKEKLDNANKENEGKLYSNICVNMLLITCDLLLLLLLKLTKYSSTVYE